MNNTKEEEKMIWNHIKDIKPILKKGKYGQSLPIVIYADNTIEKRELLKIATFNEENMEWQIFNNGLWWDVNWTFFTHWAYIEKKNEPYFTEQFQVVTGIEGEIEVSANEYFRYGYRQLGKPEKTGTMIEVAGDQIPEYVVLLIKE